MDLSVFAPPWGPTATPGELIEIAEGAERFGYHGLWVGDHVVFPRSIASPYPYDETDLFPFDPAEPLLEPITLLAFLAGQTTRISLGISVLVLPLRNPVLTAKMLAGVDAMSSGRLVVGVGTGWMREEFDALGADFERRGSVTDEWIEILRRLWAGSADDFDGEHYAFPPMGFAPRSPGIPIVVGGNSAAAMRRATGADGWHALRLAPGVLAAKVAEVRAAVGSRGGDRPFRVVYRDSLLSDAELVAGPAALAAERAAATDDRLAELRRIGVDELIVEFPGVATGHRLEWMAWLADRTLEPVAVRSRRN